MATPPRSGESRPTMAPIPRLPVPNPDKIIRLPPSAFFACNGIYALPVGGRSGRADTLSSHCSLKVIRRNFSASCSNAFLLFCSGYMHSKVEKKENKYLLRIYYSGLFERTCLYSMNIGTDMCKMTRVHHILYNVEMSTQILQSISRSLRSTSRYWHLC